MHHWTVHGKVDFPKFPADVSFAGVHSTTEHKFLILNSEMKDLH